MLQKVDTRVTTDGIAHAIVRVGDLAAATKFYGDVLGMERVDSDAWPECGKHAAFALPSGQHVVLAEGAHYDDPSVSAVHLGYAVSAAARDRIAAAVTANGGTVHGYREDRPDEATNNTYIEDPAGNRIQLVVSAKAKGTGADTIDHAALEVSDILWSEIFFNDWLGWPTLHRIGWNTQDYIAAKAKGEAGMKEAMPGTRYWNERYSPFETERKALRPCPQISFNAGKGCTVVIYLAARHYQLPPDDMTVGTPRLGFRLAKGTLGDLAGTLTTHRVRHSGPASHGDKGNGGASLYVRDPGGNFLEFTAAR